VNIRCHLTWIRANLCAFDNGSAFVDAWLLRACAKLGVRLVHSAPGRITADRRQDRTILSHRARKFLIEVTDTASEDLAAAGVDESASCW
jgi:putative transposase